MSLRANNYYKAKSVEDAYAKLQENPSNAIIAGGLWMKKTGLSYPRTCARRIYPLCGICAICRFCCRA